MAIKKIVKAQDGSEVVTAVVSPPAPEVKEGAPVLKKASEALAETNTAPKVKKPDYMPTSKQDVILCHRTKNNQFKIIEVVDPDNDELLVESKQSGLRFNTFFREREWSQYDVIFVNKDAA